jgi:hypothetical protein
MTHATQKALVKKKVTIALAPELIARMRTAVMRTPGLTLATLTALSLERMVRTQERQRGRRFFAGQGRLSVGRPPHDARRARTRPVQDCRDAIKEGSAMLAAIYARQSTEQPDRDR